MATAKNNALASILCPCGARWIGDVIWIQPKTNQNKNSLALFGLIFQSFK
jgi:hypothetical protein